MYRAGGETGGVDQGVYTVCIEQRSCMCRTGVNL